MGSLADALVYAMGVVGAVFLVMYGVALVLGLLLARSITRSRSGAATSSASWPSRSTTCPRA